MATAYERHQGVERGMDILLFDPARQKPKMGRPGKISGIAQDCRVHVTIMSDPDYDRGGPVEQVKNIRLLPPGEEPEIHEVYARLVKPVEAIVKRPRGRPPKAVAVSGGGWNGQPGRPMFSAE